MAALLRFLPAETTARGGSRPTGDRTDQPNNGKDRPPTIVVAEDEVLVRMPVADYLRDCGYRVLEASNAAEVVGLLRAREPIQIVFSDVNMPGEMNGFALASWIRREYPDVRVILASGIANLAETAQDLCIEGPVLAKPYSVEDLVRHIKRLLGHSA